jgi:hypothetical protein
MSLSGLSGGLQGLSSLSGGVATAAPFTPASVTAVNLFLPSDGEFFAADGTTPWASGAVGRWNPGKVGTPYASNATGSQQPTKTATGLQTVDGTTVLNLSSAVSYAGDFVFYLSGSAATGSSKWFWLSDSATGQGLFLNYGNTSYANSITGVSTFHTPSITGSQLMRIRRVGTNVYFAATGLAEILATGVPSTGTFRFDRVMQNAIDPTTNTSNRYRSCVGKTGGAVDADDAAIRAWFLTTDGVSL